jgi:hypothetical protein
VTEECAFCAFRRMKNSKGLTIGSIPPATRTIKLAGKSPLHCCESCFVQIQSGGLLKPGIRVEKTTCRHNLPYSRCKDSICIVEKLMSS